MISNGIKEKTELMNSKNISLNLKVQAKKDYTAKIMRLKKEIVQEKKHTKIIKFTN